VTISVEELRARVTFTQRVFRGVRTRSRPGALIAELDAPIVDRTAEE
jgi:hypothetical protein